MGRVVSGCGWAGYGMRCDLLVNVLKVRPPSFPSRAWGNSLFSAASQNPFAHPHRLAGSSILLHTTLSLFKDRGHLLCQTPAGVVLLVRLDHWSQGNTWSTDSVVSLCPYKLLLTPYPSAREAWNISYKSDMSGPGSAVVTACGTR